MKEGVGGERYRALQFANRAGEEADLTEAHIDREMVEVPVERCRLRVDLGEDRWEGRHWNSRRSEVALLEGRRSPVASCLSCLSS